MTVEVTVPGSKSITQRALVTSALATGESVIEAALDSEDTRLLRNGLRMLGAEIEDGSDSWTIQGTAGRLREPAGEIFMGNNGTGMRFLMSIAALAEGTTILTGSTRMEERPAEPLLKALRDLGVDAFSIKGTGCPPVRIKSQGIAGGQVRLSASISSQFLSSLLLAAPCAASPITIILDGRLVSRPYIDITKKVMEDFGVVVQEAEDTFQVPCKPYQGRRYQVEADASSASYFLAAAAVTGKAVRIKNLPQNPIQGDAAFADILEQMGCRIKRDGTGTMVHGPERGALRAIDIDMGKWPDIVPTLAVVAAFARGTTTISNVAHLRVKETDRIKAVVTELNRIGAQASELSDGLIVKGGGREMSPAVIRTYEDHRIAMAFAVAGLRVDGIEFEDRSVVVKSFPDFWKRWNGLRKALDTDKE